MNNINSINGENFELVFKQFYPKLCVYACRYVSDNATSENIVSDLFTKLWEQKDSIVITTSVQSYLYRATSNSCINHLKKNRQNEELTDQIEAAMESDNFRIPMIGQEIEAEILFTIELLPDKRKEIFKLNRLEGKKIAEIAISLNISESTVKNQLGDAMKFLREKLKKYL